MKPKSYLSINAPEAKKIKKVITQHGNTRIDNYDWLRDKNWQSFIEGNLNFNNPNVKNYLEEEECYTNKVMQDSENVKKSLYDEILSRIKEDDESYPYQRNNYFYYQREEKGKDYPILCRKKNSINSQEEIYFDVNEEAKNKKLYISGLQIPNEANDLFAYAFNLTGSLERIIRVRDLKSGKDFEWDILNSTGSFTWVDNENIMYIERGPSSRGQKVYLVNVFKGPSEKILVFDKPKECDSMFMSLDYTNDKMYYVLYLASGSTSRIYIKSKNDSGFSLFAIGTNDIQYSLEHHNNSFYILTNDNASNFMVYKTDVKKIKKDSWEVFIEEDKTNYLTDISIYRDKIILQKSNNEKALPEIEIIDLTSKEMSQIKMPDEVYGLHYIGAHDSNSKFIRFEYESNIQPPQDIDINIETGEIIVLKTREVPNYDSSNYILKREYANAHDGEQIPLTIVYHKDINPSNNEKAYIYGYGSYGIGMPSYFSSSIFSLIDRGYVFIIAHIRGGDDKGHQWYLDGKMKHKLNTFKDFISSCEFLIEKGLAKKGKIVANGGSAGGLLMGAVTNMRPDLFGAVIADVPFVDVINTISDETLPLTPPEWEEWGNPIENKEDFEYIMTYSPYDNIEKKNYPPMLFNSGISDEQVTYWEPAKMVAKLRELKTDNNLLLLNIKMHAGHAGSTKRYEWIEDKAFNFTFILKCLE